MKPISKKKFIKFLNKHGWVLDRRSKHDIYTHPNKPLQLAVPNDVIISPGTRRNILKKMKQDEVNNGKIENRP